MAKDIYCYTRYGRRVHLVWSKENRLTWCWAVYDYALKDTSGEVGAVCKTCRRVKDSN